MRRPQIVVGEQPPSFGNAEDQVDPTTAYRPLTDHQQAARRKKSMQVAERRAKVSRRVEYVRREYDVEAMGRHVLLSGISLDVEDTEAHETHVAKLFLCPADEER